MISMISINFSKAYFVDLCETDRAIIAWYDPDCLRIYILTISAGNFIYAIHRVRFIDFFWADFFTILE